MPASISIERASHRHLQSYWEALDTVARERRYLMLLEAPSSEDVASFVTKVLNEGGQFFWAVAGADVVGWCDLRRGTHPARKHIVTLGMGVVAAFRGRGIGSALLDQSLRAAFADGVERVELEVYGSNEAAIRLYERFEFVTEGVKQCAFRLNDREDDLHLMARFSPQSGGPPLAPLKSRLTRQE